MKIVEIVFYIHGVSPNTRPESHCSDYKDLHLGIMKALGEESLWPNEYGGAEWGWNHDKGIREGHKTLADAQRIFGGQINACIKENRDTTLNPARPAFNKARTLLFHGFGDMFYYVSAEGKWSVRYSVAQQLKKHIFERFDNSSDTGVSLTLLGHSAGSVVAFDFLYYLFNDISDDESLTWAKDNKVDIEAENDLMVLKKLVKQKRLRLRQLITFGSPISMLMFRNDSLVEFLAAKEPLDPDKYGFKSELKGTALDEKHTRWINLWEKDDIISWPVEPIMSSDLVKDVAVDMSDWSFDVHSHYWSSKKCHVGIAKHW